MRKTRHQSFVEELHKQLSVNSDKQTNISNNEGGDYDGDTSKADIIKEIEKKFSELFVEFDDNS